MFPLVYYYASKLSPDQGVRAHRLAPPQRLATALDKYNLWVTLSVDEGRDGRLEPPRVSICAQPPLLSAHKAVDKQVANKLACVQWCRREMSSPPAFTVPVGWCKLAARTTKTRLCGAAARSVPYLVPLFGRCKYAFWCRHDVSKSLLSAGHSGGQQPLLHPFPPLPRIHPCVLVAAAWPQGGPLDTDCIDKFTGQ